MLTEVTSCVVNFDYNFGFGLSGTDGHRSVKGRMPRRIAKEIKYNLAQPSGKGAAAFSNPLGRIVAVASLCAKTIK